MPSLSDLVDNFNDSEIGPEWGNSYEGAHEAGGEARVPCKVGLYAGYQTGRAWTFAGATVYLKLAKVPAASTGTNVTCDFLIICATPGTNLGFEYNAVTGMLRMMSNVDYWDPAAVEIPYDPVAHLWLRLREDGTNVYWDTSPDGTTWTNRRTLASPAWIAASIDDTALDLWAYRDAGVEDYAAYDNVNTLADGAVHDANAALTAETAMTVSAVVAAHATAALTADTVLVASPTLAAHAAASLAGQAALAADAASSEIPEVAGLAAGHLDLHLEQGATFVQNYRVADVSGFTWDGWSVRAQIRSAPASEHGDLLLDLGDYLTVIGDTIRLAIPASVTETLTRNGVWDLEVVKAGTVVRLLQGRAVVSLEVTR
ncbi:predicted protein [Streptomyces viridosporus ATCC 14672]|uniref:Predicted protein n=1 Tax=Streptomyces viridosporus (strain ATCC 14672 / DSM 40746 / JCM 4963 / KCTC 9882 / NRRL B-12104 / FH 1290) TaxID=566461 RepID=D6A4D9_STRV1|nr:hypothetical protein [Streptomyces viridosporus]EFE65779.1 predicted protein [Streptomyces viridosporus ATCC 14672]